VGGFGEVAALFLAWRSPAGEQLVLQDNQFVEGLVPNAITRTLDHDEWAEYLRPWSNAGEDRRPTLTWPRQIPIDGEPADVHATIEAPAQFLSATPIPKLFINVEPGLAMTDRERAFARTFPEQTEVTVEGLHFAQEYSPDETATRSPSSSAASRQTQERHETRGSGPGSHPAATPRSEPRSVLGNCAADPVQSGSPPTGASEAGAL
jgi:hypothetical protein